MTTNVKVLSWAIGLYVVFADIFGSSLVRNLNEDLHACCMNGFLPYF